MPKEIDLHRIRRMSESFPDFLIELWKDRGFDKKAPLSDVELDIAKFACNPIHGRRRVVLAFRGIGKTHLVTAALSCWRALRDRNRQIIIPSKSLDAARKTVRLIREWTEESWMLQGLAPRPNQRDAVGGTTPHFDFGGAKENRQASVLAIGVGGQLENNRAHSIFPDDMETKGNSKTREAREELARMVTEFTNILYPDRPHSDGGPVDPVEIVVVGTPKHEETLYFTLVKRHYHLVSWPIAYPSAHDRVVNLAPILKERLDKGLAKPGDPTCPHRFPESEIAVRRAEGRTEFARENMLIADLADEQQYPLRLSDLMVMDVNRDRAPACVMYGQRDHNGSTAADIPADAFGDDKFYRPASIDNQWLPYQTTKAWIDPAGRGEDDMVVSIVGILGGTLYLKALVGIRGGPTADNLVHIAETLRAHDAREVYVEHNWGGGTFELLLDPVIKRLCLRPGEHPAYPDGWACALVQDTKITHQAGGRCKEDRIIDTLEPVTSSHRLVIDTSVARNDKFVQQYTRIRREPKCLAHDDYIDALAGSVRACSLSVRVDPEKASIDLRQREFDRLLDEHWQIITGRKPKKPRW